MYCLTMKLSLKSKHVYNPLQTNMSLQCSLNFELKFDNTTIIKTHYTTGNVILSNRLDVQATEELKLNKRLQVLRLVYLYIALYLGSVYASLHPKFLCPLCSVSEAPLPERDGI